MTFASKQAADGNCYEAQVDLQVGAESVKHKVGPLEHFLGCAWQIQGPLQFVPLRGIVDYCCLKTPTLRLID